MKCKWLTLVKISGLLDPLEYWKLDKYTCVNHTFSFSIFLMLYIRDIWCWKDCTFPGLAKVAQTVKNLPAMWETQSGRSPGEGNSYPLHPTPVLLPGKCHGRRSLVGCSPWGRWGLDTTKLLHFHFSLSCIGEGNGNSLQWSCLENPRDRGAWWAAVCGVAQSQTRLKRLSSSSSQLY